MSFLSVNGLMLSCQSTEVKCTNIKRVNQRHISDTGHVCLSFLGGWGWPPTLSDYVLVAGSVIYCTRMIYITIPNGLQLPKVQSQQFPYNSDPRVRTWKLFRLESSDGLSGECLPVAGATEGQHSWSERAGAGALSVQTAVAGRRGVQHWRGRVIIITIVTVGRQAVCASDCPVTDRRRTRPARQLHDIEGSRAAAKPRNGVDD